MSKVLVLDRGENLAVQIRGLADEFRPHPDVISCTRIGEVAEVLDEEGPFDVLVAGPSLGTRSGLARLQIIHEELPDMALVLAFSRRPDASLRDIVRTGAIDLLQLPADDKELVDSLERALDISSKMATGGGGEAETSGHVDAEGVEHEPGRVFTISSATGGCGKTFLATNFAHFLVKYTGKRAVIVDLDLQFGEVSTALRLRPRYTIFDALQREDTDEADLMSHIEEYCVQHETGVWVLAAPKDPQEADRISPPDVTRIIEALRHRYDYVVVDTPPALTEIVLAAFDLSDMLFSMATLDLPSVRNMSVFLGTLEKLKVPSDNIRLILNKAESDVGIDIDQVTKLFPQGFQAVLPYAREVSRSINLGMPVMAASPGSEISQRMLEGLKAALPDHLHARVDEDLQVTKKTGLFGRIFGRS